MNDDLYRLLVAANRHRSDSTSSSPSDWLPGMAAQPLQSPALQRAARRELDRLLADQRRIEQRLEAIDNERAHLREELRVIGEQSALLEAVLGGGKPAGAAPASAGVVLRGARLREEAARVLLSRAGPNVPVHYATWHDWLAEEGFVVLGKRPKSTFLTGASRSILIQRAEEPGTYLATPAALHEVQRELDEKQAELADVDAVLAQASGSATTLRQHRVAVLAAIRRLSGQVAEAQRVLDAVRKGAIRAA
jgi:septal ring factor EnvC (AmiA/AmiB activator)